MHHIGATLVFWNTSGSDSR